MLMVLTRQAVKEPAPAKAGVSVSSMFSSTQPVSFEYFADHLVSQAARSRRASGRSRRSPGSGFAGPRTGSEPAQLLQAVVVHPRFREGRLLRVDTPCTYISVSAATSARSERG